MMLAEKYAVEKNKEMERRSFIARSIDRIKNIDPEQMVGGLSDLLFKAILVFAVPYFIYVLIKFLSL